jgi:16S rRNA (guanine966-N2)-methyltransferase
MAKTRKASGTPAKAGMRGRFRIIGGSWRSRRLVLPAVAEVRPTPDRARETLFNWLAPVIGGARCLDLYAGSGALGLEALSRGAAEVTFVDRNPAVLRQLAETLALLQCTCARTVCMDALSFLAGPATPFDVVFVDPPYRQGLLEPVITQLAARSWLAPGAQVYLEHGAGCAPPTLPAGWVLHRSASAGQVRYHLARSECSPAEQQ